MRHTNYFFVFAFAFATLQGTACSSSTPQTEAGETTEGTEPVTPPSGSDPQHADVPGTPSVPLASEDGGVPADADAPVDAMAPIDGGSDSAPVDAGPTAFTQAEVQTLMNARCAPCHVGGASAGMSLAGNFTTATVGVASTELPSMKRIQAGSRANSYLFHKLAGTHLTVGGSGLRMPRSGPPYLTDLEIERIGKYIDGL